MIRRTVTLLVLLIGFAAAPMNAQKTTEPSAAEIMQHVEKGFAAVEDFTVTLSADVDMERVRVPKMTATLYFKKPDKIHVASTSFAMLPRDGIVLNPALMNQRYQAELKGKENVEGKELYKISMTAREGRVRPSQLTIWIDPANWTVARMESAPYQGRALKLAISHELQQGGVWLPKLLVASFESTARDTLPRLDLNMQGVPDPDEQRRPPRNGKITVTYSDYKLNSGLSDEIFERKDSTGKTKE